MNLYILRTQASIHMHDISATVWHAHLTQSQGKSTVLNTSRPAAHPSLRQMRAALFALRSTAVCHHLLPACSRTACICRALMLPTTVALYKPGRKFYCMLTPLSPKRQPCRLVASQVLAIAADTDAAAISQTHRQSPLHTKAQHTHTRNNATCIHTSQQHVSCQCNLHRARAMQPKIFPIS